MGVAWIPLKPSVPQGLSSPNPGPILCSYELQTRGFQEDVGERLALGRLGIAGDHG